MAWVKKLDRMVPGSSSIAYAQVQMARLADIVVNASSNWSYAQYVYDSNKTALILTHTSDAQIIMAWAATSTVVRNTNMYGGGSTASYTTYIAYKPVNGLSYAAITDTINPYDTTTYCADAGSYTFIKSFLSSGASDNIALYGGFFTVVVDDTDPNLFMFMTEPALSDNPDIGDLILCLDDGISELEEGGDSNTSIFGGVSTSQALMDQTPKAVTQAGLKIQFQDSAGTVIEDGILSPRQGDLITTTQRAGINQGYDRDRVSVSSDTGAYARGRKGFMSVEMLSAIRGDAMRNVRMTCTSNHYLHLDSGTVIPWESAPPLQ